MGPFEMVFGIVLVACACGLVGKWIDRRPVRSEGATEDSAEVQRMLRDLDKMERRMENLETILLERVQRPTAGKR